MNQVSWFNIKVTHDTFNPEVFMEIKPNLNVKNAEDNQSMSQIFPNPISSFGLLKYQLAESSKVSIKLINIYGVEIATIFEGFKNTGTHKLEINCSNLNT
ncbi:hypothetical protein [Mariniflexile sp. HMF6888]|uniref:hypothetical protein n=1 Tax=Mariniflexile sp. HMF6888 TaxID=3373086 RepID=UPI0037B72BB1